jgi:hypothetical protein
MKKLYDLDRRQLVEFAEFCHTISHNGTTVDKHTFDPYTDQQLRDYCVNNCVAHFISVYF